MCVEDLTAVIWHVCLSPQLVAADAVSTRLTLTQTHIPHADRFGEEAQGLPRCFWNCPPSACCCCVLTVAPRLRRLPAQATTVWWRRCAAAGRTSSSTASSESWGTQSWTERGMRPARVACHCSSSLNSHSPTVEDIDKSRMSVRVAGAHRLVCIQPTQRKVKISD